MTTVGVTPRPHSASKDRGDQPVNDQAIDDDKLISTIINGDNFAADAVGDSFSFGDTVGKVDDAVDYEDISDDDLPSEEDVPSKLATAADDNDEDMDLGGDLLAGIADEDGGDGKEMDFDDLFGDMSGEIMNDPVGPTSNVGLTDLDSFGLGNDALTSEVSGTGSDDLFSGGMDYSMQDIAIGGIPIQNPEDLARQYFPDFKPHSILSFSTLFKAKPGTLQTGPQKVPKVCVPTKIHVEMAPDENTLFNKATSATHKGTTSRARGIITITPPIEEHENEDEEMDHGKEGVDPIFERDLEIACCDWDSKLEAAMVTPPPSPPPQMTERDEIDDGVIELGRPAKVCLYNLGCASYTKRQQRRRLDPMYLDTLPESWIDEEAIFEGDLSKLASKVTLDLNDPHLLIDIRQPDQIRRTRRIGGEFKRRLNKDITHKYNISNDEAYDLLKENHQNRVRSTIGQLNIEHTLPALRLQSPYYKTKLSTKEARSFHRPSLHFSTGHEIRFDKIKLRKRKTYRGKDIQEIFATTKDISLSDGSPFVLLEYSEEYPTVLSNFGMGSRLINYYRRKNPEDESRPKSEVGETHVLMPQDRSPFWNFGAVEPGETVPTLYNKMVRAPIFKHEPKNTDFLVVRSSYENASRYYLRTIPYLFTVGQLFPVTEVPGPHSRKVTTAAKNRLKMICYRVVKRKSDHAIAVRDISTHFPENNDMQNRQKMKEFMSYQKNSGLWEMKPGEGVMDERTIRSMIKPEDLCLLEAMQVGVRNLEDSGYAKTVEDEDDDGKDGMSLEQQLTPWVSTKNFLNATQGKAMLQLHGEGDPSGRGEAFSFVRTSMKGGFKDVGESIDEKMDKQRLKELGGHSYNVARQQKQYEEAIDRIWRAQFKSLSSTEEHPDIDIEDAHRDEEPTDDLFEEGRTPRSEGTPWLHRDDETTSQFSRMSAKTQSRKVLKITRRVINKHGDRENQVEVIRDPKVIRQYLQKRRELDAEKTQVEALVPTGNIEEDNHAKKR